MRLSRSLMILYVIIFDAVLKTRNLGVFMVLLDVFLPVSSPLSMSARCSTPAAQMPLSKRHDCGSLLRMLQCI